MKDPICLDGSLMLCYQQHFKKVLEKFKVVISGGDSQEFTQIDFCIKNPMINTYCVRFV